MPPVNDTLSPQTMSPWSLSDLVISGKPSTDTRQKQKQTNKQLFKSFFKRFYLFIFRQRGREGEREGEKPQCVVASHTPPAGDLACNPGVCPDWELKW